MSDPKSIATMSSLSSSLSSTFPSSLVILGLCYNSEASIKHTLHQLDTMVSRYRESKIIILESNSTDKTMSLLQEWASNGKSTHHTRLVKTETKTKTIVNKMNFMKKYKFANYQELRFPKMSILRNILIDSYLDALKHASLEFKTNHHVCMMDLDIGGDWNIAEVWNITEHQTQSIPSASNIAWSGVACMGLNKHKSWFPCSKNNYTLLQPDWMYYDQLAFRNNSGQHKCFKFPNVNLKVSHNWVSVQSAFSGLCIYKPHVFQTFRYNESKDLKVCEHVPFHKQLIDAGFKLFVNPNLVLFYQAHPNWRFPLAFSETEPKKETELKAAPPEPKIKNENETAPSQANNIVATTTTSPIPRLDLSKVVDLKVAKTVTFDQPIDQRTTAVFTLPSKRQPPLPSKQLLLPPLVFAPILMPPKRNDPTLERKIKFMKQCEKKMSRLKAH